MTKDLRLELLDAYIFILICLGLLDETRQVFQTLRELAEDEDPDAPQVLRLLLKKLPSKFEGRLERCRERGLEIPGHIPQDIAERIPNDLFADEDEDRLARRLRGLRTELRDVAPPLRAVEV